MTAEWAEAESWQKVLAGDSHAFSRLTEPLLPALREAAAHELESLLAAGELAEELTTPDEVVGEALLRAWRQRRRKPETLGLEAWLLKIIYRVIDELAHRERRRRALAEAVGSQQPELPPLEDEAQFWEWFQPEDLPIGEPLLPEPPPTPEEITARLGARPKTLTTSARRALWLHRRHRLQVREISAVLKRPAAEVRDMVEKAAAAVRQGEAEDRGKG